MKRHLIERQMKAVDLAIERAGGLRALARRLDISAPAVQQWRCGKRQVPFKRAWQIEALYGVPKEELHPDILWHI